ncbi:MAG: hypothetical protein P9M09_01455 [Candidatus Celaenobacter antarcticus]|nr:hypothetical protein [Candidatus Celaenobacter antarcticus]
MKKILQVIVILIIIFSFSSCKSQELSSEYSTSDRVIDGLVDEWEEDEMTFLEKQDVMVGSVNDDGYLYISFYSTSRERAMQLMMSGFTVWIDANGKKKSFGIHYPVRNIDGMEMQKSERGVNKQSREEKSSTDNAKPDFMEKVDKNLVIIDGKDEKEYKIEYLQDIQVAYTFNREMFIYELKIPLTAKDHEYSIEPTDKNVIYVCLETDEVERAQGHAGGPGQGGPPSGGMGDRPQGGQGGGPGGQMRGDMQEMPSRFEVWMTIHLGTPTDLENE